MFCTLEEAAEKLQTTTAEVEMMVANGTFREFRDGATRLVKSADVEAMAARPVAAAAVQTAPDRPADARSDPPPAQQTEGPDHGINIRPRAEAAAPSARPESNRRREVREPPLAPAQDYEHTTFQRRLPARAARPSMPRHSQTSPSTQRLTLRQWVWMGLVDDRPHVLIALFLAVTVGIGGLVAAVYLLTRWL